MNRWRQSKWLGLLMALVLLVGAVWVPPAQAAPTLNAKAAILIEQSSGKVLWGQNQTQKMYPASTTKIMTAMLALEKLQMDDKITLPGDFVNVGETGLALRAGTTQTAEELLMAMMLYSANDAAQAVAIGTAGSVDAFVELMNRRVADMGLTGTHFANPHGLHNENHYTTAYDLAMIARAALDSDEFRRIINTKSYTLKKLNGESDYTVYNRNDLLSQYDKADGVKTGYTRQAGNTFVGSATKDGMQLIAVVLNSTDIYGDAKALLDWGFANYAPTQILEANQQLGQVAVLNGGRDEVLAVAEKSLYYIGKKGDVPGFTESVDLPSSVNAPIHRGEVVGTVTYTNSAGESYSSNLLAARDVGRYSLRLVVRQAFLGVWQVFVVPFSQK